MTNFNSNQRSRRQTISSHKKNKIDSQFKYDKHKFISRIEIKDDIDYAKIDGKPVLFIWDEPRIRSPNLTRFFETLVGLDDAPFKAIFITKIKTDIEKLCNKHLNGKPPEYLYTGFKSNPLSYDTKKYIKENDIKLICETGDINIFGRQNIGPFIAKSDRGTKGLNIKFLVHRSKYGLNRFNGCKKQFTSVKNTKLLYLPWSVDIDTFNSENVTKDIDASFIATTYRHPKRHGKRRIVKNILNKIENKNKDMNFHIDNTYGQKYIDILKRTKIFILITNNFTQPITQKYIESGAAGCMIMGDNTTMASKYFKHNKSIIEVKNYRNMPNRIKYYLNHPEEIERISNNSQNIVKNNFSMNATINKFIKNISMTI